MGVLTKIFSQGADALVGTAFKGLDSLITSKQEKGEIQIKLEELENVRRQGEMDFKLESKKIEFAMSEQEFKDRDSAREMQTKTKSKIPGILAIVFTVFYFVETAGFLAMILKFIDIELQNYAVAMMSALWGATSTIEAQIIAFYFGSSKSAEDQNENAINAVSAAGRNIDSSMNKV